MSSLALPDGWIEKSFSAVVKRLQSEGGKLTTNDYQETGGLSVVDQGQTLVVAYCDDSKRAFQGPYPVIVFGDHTRNVKLIDFKFAVGADGVVLIRPKDDSGRRGFRPGIFSTFEQSFVAMRCKYLGVDTGVRGLGAIARR